MRNGDREREPAARYRRYQAGTSNRSGARSARSRRFSECAGTSNRSSARPGRSRRRGFQRLTVVVTLAVLALLAVGFSRGGASTSHSPSASLGRGEAPGRVAPATLDQILARHHLSDSSVGLLACDLRGRTIAKLHAGALFVPASNEKLLTTSAAAAILGLGYRFRTRVLLSGDARIQGGVISGDLILKGAGDPTLTIGSSAAATGEYQLACFSPRLLGTSRLEEVVESLRSQGIRRIEGSVLADSSAFSTRTSLDCWTPDQSSWCPPLGGLAVNENEGVQGDPGVAAAARLTTLLQTNGVVVEGRPGTAGHAAQGRVLCTIVSAPLRQILAAMNEESDNFLAEMLLRSLGWKREGVGTSDAGTRAVLSHLAKAGIECGRASILDGSGLSEQDRLSPRLLAHLLLRDSHTLPGLLPVAGRSGTLATRMVGTVAEGVVRAKSGSLHNACCLSGYVMDGDRPVAVFSILCAASPEQAESAVDEIAAAFAAAATR